MTEKQFATEMYSRGYRYILHPPTGSKNMDPVYVKTAMQIGEMWRTLFPNDRPNAQTIEDYLKESNQ